MMEVPEPIRTGSPASYHKHDQEVVPVPTQAATPSSTTRPPVSRSWTVLSSTVTTPKEPPHARASRPRSVHQTASRLPPPFITISAARQSYAIPEAASPPQFENDTTYRADAFAAQHLPIERKPSRARSFLNRIASFRSQKSYRTLGDDDGGNASNVKRGPSLRSVDEEEIGPGYGIDLSQFEGPIALRSLSNSKSTSISRKTASRGAGSSLEDEYYRLEAEVNSAQLGGGMLSVMDRPFTWNNDTPAVTREPSRRMSLRRCPSKKDNVDIAREDAQKEAEKTGDIVAVTESAAVDLSNLAGGEAGTPLSAGADGPNDKGKKSYYFPEDPEQPDWKPVAMHWGYILLLIVFALALAGVQEYLCQLSMKKTKEGSGIYEFVDPDELNMTQYFAWKYAPTLVLVTYGVLWQITDFETKRLEPYYQLSKRTGAKAEESLNIDYLTFLMYLTPLKALRYRQCAPLLSSCSYLIAGSLVPVLQSASVNLEPDKDKREDDEPKFVRIDPAWSRSVTAMLLLVALMGTNLLFQLRRKSGLLSDPKGIAGLAAMATRSHILNDFNGLDTAPQSIIHKQLHHRRYILHKSSLWQAELIRHSDTFLSRTHQEYKKKLIGSRPLMLTNKGAIPFLAVLILFIILIPAFIFNPSANEFTEKLPWFLTAYATMIKLLWTTLDCDTRLLEPFYLLSRRNAPPQTLTLDYTGTVPGYISFKALMNKHYLVALVGVGAIASEILTVCVSSFSVDGSKYLPHPNDKAAEANVSNSSETFKSFWVSFILALGILLYLVFLTCLIHFTPSRGPYSLFNRSHAFLPRSPATLSSVLAYIHQSHMLYSFSFEGAEKYSSKQMTLWLKKQGKTYGLGWFRGRDEGDHCGIEEEDRLISGYDTGLKGGPWLWSEGRVGAGVGTWEHY